MAGPELQRVTRSGRTTRRAAVLAIFAIVLVPVAGIIAAGTWMRDPGARATNARATPVRTLLLHETRPFEISIGPVDGGSLEPIPGLDPLALGHHFVHDTGPDGRGVALVAWPGEGRAGGQLADGQLRLIDVEAWKVRPIEASIDPSVVDLAFAPDGNQLYWAAAPASPTDAGHLVRAEVVSGRVLGRASLPRTLYPWEIHPTRAGGVAVFAVGVDPVWQSNDPPKLLLIDPAALEVTSEIDLDTVVAGQRGSHASGRFFRPGLAWDTARDRLYVLDAQQDRVTVVDLDAARVVAAAELEAARSPLDELWAWLVPTARAKLMPGTDRTAVVDPEGRRLYVATMRRTWSDDRQEFHEQAQGGFVVDTETLGIVGSIDQPVSELALSPDGARLLATGTDVVSRHDEAGVVTPHGLFVLDPVSLGELAHIPSSGPMRVASFSADGGSAYLQIWQDRPTGGQECVIRTLDLVGLAVVAERRFSGYCDIIAAPVS